MRIILNSLLILEALILNACGARAPAIEPVEVKVPVPVSCVSQQAQEPDWNLSHLTSDATEVEQLKAALADLELSRGYIEELRAELSGCG